MLVVSRKKYETIRVGNTTFTILHVRGDKVRVGIDAPPDVKIVRGELMAQQQVELDDAETQHVADSIEQDHLCDH